MNAIFVQVAILALICVGCCVGEDAKKPNVTTGKNATASNQQNHKNNATSKSKVNMAANGKPVAYPPTSANNPMIKPPQSGSKIGPRDPGHNSSENETEIQRYLELLEQCTMNNPEVAPYASKILELAGTFAKNLGLD